MGTLFVASDLHLGETGLARMFHDHSQGMRFAELCSFVARTPDSELLLLGDIFDVTASLPPRPPTTRACLSGFASTVGSAAVATAR